MGGVSGKGMSAGRSGSVRGPSPDPSKKVSGGPLQRLAFYLSSLRATLPALLSLHPGFAGPPPIGGNASSIEQYSIVKRLL